MRSMAARAAEDVDVGQEVEGAVVQGGASAAEAIVVEGTEWGEVS